MLYLLENQIKAIMPRAPHGIWGLLKANESTPTGYRAVGMFSPIVSDPRMVVHSPPLSLSRIETLIYDQSIEIYSLYARELRWMLKGQELDRYVLVTAIRREFWWDVQAFESSPYGEVVRSTSQALIAGFSGGDLTNTATKLIDAIISEAYKDEE